MHEDRVSVIVHNNIKRMAWDIYSESLVEHASSYKVSAFSPSPNSLNRQQLRFAPWLTIELLDGIQEALIY